MQKLLTMVVNKYNLIYLFLIVIPLMSNCGAIEKESKTTQDSLSVLSKDSVIEVKQNISVGISPSTIQGVIIHIGYRNKRAIFKNITDNGIKCYALNNGLFNEFTLDASDPLFVSDSILVGLDSVNQNNMLIYKNDIFERKIEFPCKPSYIILSDSNALMVACQFYNENRIYKVNQLGLDSINVQGVPLFYKNNNLLLLLPKNEGCNFSFGNYNITKGNFTQLTNYNIRCEGYYYYHLDELSYLVLSTGDETIKIKLSNGKILQTTKSKSTEFSNGYYAYFDFQKNNVMFYHPDKKDFKSVDFK